MKKRCTEEQIIGFPREAQAGLAVAELCRRYGFSQAINYLWRSKFGGMNVPDAKRLNEFETDNARLKRLLTEFTLDKEVTKEALRNQVLSMDFVFGRTAEGRRIKNLTVVDDVTHEAVAIVPERALGGNQLVRIPA